MIVCEKLITISTMQQSLIKQKLNLTSFPFDVIIRVSRGKDNKKGCKHNVGNGFESSG